LSFCLDDEMDKAEDQLLGANTVNNENAEVWYDGNQILLQSEGIMIISQVSVFWT
jgi:hypothetical protein